MPGALGIPGGGLLTGVEEISTERVEGAVQYLVVALFRGLEGHDAHDNDPRFKA